MKTVKISAGNTKTGRIPAVSMTPIKSCGNCEHCKKACYALKSYRQYENTRKAWDFNYNLYLARPDQYFSDIFGYLANKNPRFFRWHVSGDIIDQQYLEGVKDIAKCFPDTNFLVFTKMFDLNYRNIPENLQVVFSIFPGMSKPRKKMQRAYAINEGDTIPANSVNCPGNCETCGACWSLSKMKKDVYFYMH